MKKVPAINKIYASNATDGDYVEGKVFVL